MSNATNQSALATKRAVDCLWHKHSGRTGKQVRAAAKAKYDASYISMASRYVVCTLSDGQVRVTDTEIFDETVATGGAVRKIKSDVSAKRLANQLIAKGARVVRL